LGEKGGEVKEGSGISSPGKKEKGKNLSIYVCGKKKEGKKASALTSAFLSTLL